MPIWDVLKQTVVEALDDKVMRLSAALSFYSIFSLAPLLLISVAIAGAVFGEEAASGRLAEHLREHMGPAAAEALQEMVRNTREPTTNVIATLTGIVMLLVGAGGAFAQLQDALNTVWGLQPRPGRGLRGMLRDRFLSFGMVLGTGFLLLVSLVLSTALQAVSVAISEVAMLPPVVWSAISSGLTFIVIALLFGAIYRILPDADIGWRDVWLGAVVTAAFFTFAKFGLTWYLGREATTSSYGSAGSLILILLWVYFSSLILLLGAEFTHVYARSQGKRIVPSAMAIRVDRTPVPVTDDSA